MSKEKQSIIRLRDRAKLERIKARVELDQGYKISDAQTLDWALNIIEQYQCGALAKEFAKAFKAHSQFETKILFQFMSSMLHQDPLARFSDASTEEEFIVLVHWSGKPKPEIVYKRLHNELLQSDRLAPMPASPGTN